MFTLKELAGIVSVAIVFWIVRSLTDPNLMSAAESGDPAFAGQALGGLIGALLLTTVAYLIVRKLYRIAGDPGAT